MPYVSAYPRPGQVALLCEGDLIGYEATLFQKWTGVEFGNEPLVDIWSCGTSTSIFGVSDAIGRSRPIFAIEDRDFRSVEEAREDCKRNRKNREDREIRVIEWSAWNRCEIENYLLEPDVLFPIFSAVFGCSGDDVINALMKSCQLLRYFRQANMRRLAHGVCGCQLIQRLPYYLVCVQDQNGRTAESPRQITEHFVRV